MKIVPGALWVFAVFGKLASGEWDCSPDCWNYEECLDGNARRALEPDLLFAKDTSPGDDKTVEGESEMMDAKALAQQTNLRGRIQHRQLEEEYYFNIKLHWEEDYCVSKQTCRPLDNAGVE